jgi:hypothetical protein
MRTPWTRRSFLATTGSLLDSSACPDVNCWWKNAANGAIITVVFSRGDPQNDSKREVGVFSRDGVVRAMAETG